MKKLAVKNNKSSRWAPLALALAVSAALPAAYADDVRARRFPSAEYCFGAPKTDGAEVRQLKP